MRVYRYLCAFICVCIGVIYSYIILCLFTHAMCGRMHARCLCVLFLVSTYVYKCIYLYISIYRYVYTCLYKSIDLYVYVCVYMSLGIVIVHACVVFCRCLFRCVYIWLYVFIYIYVCICTFMCYRCLQTGQSALISASMCS